MKCYLYNCKKHLVVLLLAFASITSTYAQEGFSPQTVAKLQAVLQSFQNDPAFVGGMSAAINVDGLATWTGATGYASRNVDANYNLLPGGTPFTTSTVSQIYSVTKTFTAALTLELAKQGVFSLDDPISKFIPLNAINPELNSSVTIRQLLAHESGYSDYITEQQLQIAVAFDPTKIWTPFEAVYFAHQIAEPGTVRSYSSTNYLLLGAIIEIATGQPVEKLYRERFFNPLGLSSMYLSIREPQPAGTTLAAPHDNFSPFNPILMFTGRKPFPDAYTNVSSFSFNGILSLAYTSGGIASNAADLAVWGNALFGGRATSKSTLDQMMNSISTTPDKDGDYLGYGIFSNTKISQTDFFVGHNGTAPGYRALMFYQPDRKMTISILTNYAGANVYAIAKALYEALPNFICGNQNRKEDKILICSKDKSQCIDRMAASVLIRKGAYLGDCGSSTVKPTANISTTIQSINDVALFENSALNKALTVYPNPANNKVNFTYKAGYSGNVSVTLFSLTGQKVASILNRNVEKGAVLQSQLNVNNNQAGTYILRIQTDKGASLQKLVISH